MKSLAFVLFFTISHLSLFGQNNDHYTIQGTENVVQAVSQSLNSISYLKTGDISGSFTNKIWAAGDGVKFLVDGKLYIDYLEITMPDGKVFRFSYNSQKQAFVCPDFPLKGGNEEISAQFVQVFVQNARCLGSNIKVDSQQEQSFSLSGKTMSNTSYGFITREAGHLDAYGSRKDRNGKPFWTGEASDLQNLLATKPHVSVTFSGVDKQYWTGIVNDKRNGYSGWKQAQTVSNSSNSYSGNQNSNSNSASSNSSYTQQSYSNSKGYSSTTRSRNNNNQTVAQSTRIYNNTMNAVNSIDAGAAAMKKLIMGNNNNNTTDDEEEWEWQQEQKRKQAEEEARQKQEYEARQQNLKRQEEERHRIQNESNATKATKYAQKGGDANYKAKMNEFREIAINSFNAKGYKHLREYDNLIMVPFNPFENCSYVNIIKRIETSKMPDHFKYEDIWDMIRLRDLYHDYYQKYSYDGAFLVQQDNMAEQSPECGNYLDLVAEYIGFDFDSEISYGKWEVSMDLQRLFGLNDYVKKTWLYAELAAKGISDDRGNYLRGNEPYNFWRTSGYGPPEHKDATPVWLNLHYYRMPWDKLKTSSETNYGRNQLTDDQFERELNTLYWLYDLRKQNGFLNGFDYLKLAAIHYQDGTFDEALDYYKQYVFIKFGSFENFINEIKNPTGYRYIYDWNISDENNLWIPVLLSAILNYEFEDYHKTIQLYDAFLSSSNFSKLWESYKAKTTSQLSKLKMMADLKLGNLKNVVPTSPKEIKNIEDQTSLVLIAYAYYKMGDEKSAKQAFSKVFKIYKKKNYEFKNHSDVVSAFQELASAFYPKDKVKSSPITSYLLRDFSRNFHGEVVQNRKERKTLSDFEGWDNIKKQIISEGTKSSFESLFEKCNEFYKSGILEKNEQSKVFLELYTSLSICLGQFDAAMPPMIDLLDMDKDLMDSPECLLLKFMGQSYRDDIKESSGTLSRYRLVNVKNEESPIYSLGNQLKKAINNPEERTTITKYMEYWVQAGLTSYKIPFLYSLF